MVWLIASCSDTVRAVPNVPPAPDWSGSVPTYLSQRAPRFSVRRFIDQESWKKKPVTVATFFGHERRVPLPDGRGHAVVVDQPVIAEHRVVGAVVETAPLRAGLEQVFAAPAGLAEREDVVELVARVGLVLLARRGVVDLAQAGVDDAHGARRGVGLVGVVGLAVHHAEVRLEHQAVLDAGVLGLRGLHRVALHDRRDVGNAVVAVAAVAADLVVPQIRHGQLVVGRDLVDGLARVVLQVVVVDGLRAVVVAGADPVVDDPLADRAVDPQLFCMMAPPPDTLKS